jgi:hypothetical protein
MNQYLFDLLDSSLSSFHKHVLALAFEYIDQVSTIVAFSTMTLVDGPRTASAAKYSRINHYALDEFFVLKSRLNH